jgi:hypothetical protein
MGENNSMNVAFLKMNSASDELAEDIVESLQEDGFTVKSMDRDGFTIER